MKPGFVFEVYLQPGEFFWGDESTRIKTLLGSCIAICMWHPGKLIGGMCHSLLPSRLKAVPGKVEARYVEEAVQLFMSEIYKSATKPADYQVKVFGGSEMFNLPNHSEVVSIGKKNIEATKVILKEKGFNIHVEHTGGTGHRNLIYDLWSGDAWLRHVEKAIS